MKLLLFHSKAKLTEHVNQEGAGLLHRCGPFFEESKGSSGSSTKPLIQVDNDTTYKLILEKAKTSGEVGQVKFSILDEVISVLKHVLQVSWAHVKKKRCI